MKLRYSLFFLALSICIPTLAQNDYDEFEKFRIGGYGEILANFKNYDWNRFNGQATGADQEYNSTAAIPRFTIAFDYKFNPKWILGTEVEFESGGVGLETELESSENGEYETEMERGGEVALEQFHLTRLVCPQFNVRVGHMVVPIGLTNTQHEPIMYFGSERPEDETTILPSTWSETGLSFFGSFGKGHATFDYETQVVTGLNPDGFGRDHWVADGLQGLFEKEKFTCPALVGRLDYTGVKGLTLGTGLYYCPNTGKNADKSYKYTKCGNTGLFIFNGDLQYKNRYISARANCLYGNLQNSDKISAVYLSNKSNYHSGAMRQVAKSAVSYGGEIGVNLRTVFNAKKCPVLYPFVRYEYFNPMQSVEAGASQDSRVQVSKWQAGINYYALPNLVLKLDYANRRIGTQKVFGYSGTYNRENEISFCIAYTAWFFKDKFRKNK